MNVAVSMCKLEIPCYSSTARYHTASCGATQASEAHAILAFQKLQGGDGSCHHLSVGPCCSQNALLKLLLCATVGNGSGRVHEIHPLTVLQDAAAGRWRHAQRRDALAVADAGLRPSQPRGIRGVRRRRLWRRRQESAQVRCGQGARACAPLGSGTESKADSPDSDRGLSGLGPA